MNWVQKRIVYLDETWIHPAYTVSKCWQDSKTEGFMMDNAGQRMIIVSAGSEWGLLQGGLPDDEGSKYL
jgi:hypothetical protein